MRTRSTICYVPSGENGPKIINMGFRATGAFFVTKIMIFGLKIKDFGPRITDFDVFGLKIVIFWLIM